MNVGEVTKTVEIVHVQRLNVVTLLKMERDYGMI